MLNISNNFNDDNNILLETLNSYLFLEQSRKINLILTTIVILFGLVGNSLIIFIFGQKRFRKNSFNIYLLCLAINDNLFLIVQFFEDTLKNYTHIYTDNTNFLHSLNLIDRFQLACSLIEYLRYVLRFISAYIIVSFTIQRYMIVKSPLMSKKFESKMSACKTVISVVVASFLCNSWVPFMFDTGTHKHCMLNEIKSIFYSTLRILYVLLTMILPLITILVSNYLIKLKSVEDDLKRTEISLVGMKMSQKISKIRRSTRYKHEVTRCEYKIRVHYLNINEYINRITSREENHQKINKCFLLISITYSLLNLPYLIFWCLFYYKLKDQNNDNDDGENIIWENYLFACVKLTEIVYLLNYGINFFIYCFSGSIFRKQLRYAGILLNIFFVIF
jgi:hypothetical protein